MNSFVYQNQVEKCSPPGMVAVRASGNVRAYYQPRLLDYYRDHVSVKSWDQLTVRATQVLSTEVSTQQPGKGLAVTGFVFAHFVDTSRVACRLDGRNHIL